MTFIVENGGGVQRANSGASVEYVNSYLSSRNRLTENSWMDATLIEQQAAIVAATQYIDIRFDSKFKGSKAFSYSGAEASGSITFTGATSAGETVTIAGVTYTLSTNASASIAATELETLISAETNNGFSSVTVVSGTVTISLNFTGDSGNYTDISTTATNATIQVFSGGLDAGSQRVSWPRLYAYDDLGNAIEGLPIPYLWAICEYAVRALSSKLLPDPETNNQAGQIKRTLDQVGPIRTETEFTNGTYGQFKIKPYPEADYLLKPLLVSTGGVIR